MNLQRNKYSDLIALAKILDNQFEGPWGIKFGLDAVIGLIPGIGDFLTSALSSYILLRAALLKLPFPILLQMAINILIDQIIGTFPILGDLFDVYWKSNLKNVQLISEYAIQNEQVAPKTWRNLFLVFIFIIFILSLPILILYKILMLLS